MSTNSTPTPGESHSRTPEQELAISEAGYYLAVSMAGAQTLDEQKLAEARLGEVIASDRLAGTPRSAVEADALARLFSGDYGPPAGVQRIV